MRLDLYLYEHGHAKSRTRAAEMIVGAYVRVNGKITIKPSTDVSDDDIVSVAGESHSFVGRGGVKLDGALERLMLEVKDFVCADIGASTGGFTDCLLQRGAKKVYAIDSGHDQLDAKLRSNERVVNLEGMNARYMTEETLPELCDLAVSDLSFISQTLVLPATAKLLKENGMLISLIKPQFECGRTALNKNGIVKDKRMHIFAIRQVLSSAVSCGLMPEKIMKSTVTGGDGNTEFLFFARKNGTNTVTEEKIAEAVNE